MRRTQRDIPRTPQNTNLAGGIGCGCSPGLWRKTFGDKLVSMVKLSTRARNQGPSSVRRKHVSPRLETLVSTMERTLGATTPSGVLREENPKYRGSFVGIGGPEEIYQIDRNEVTKQEWL